MIHCVLKIKKSKIRAKRIKEVRRSQKKRDLQIAQTTKVEKQFIRHKQTFYYQAPITPKSSQRLN